MKAVSSGLWAVALLLALLAALPAHASGEFKAHGFMLPGGAVRVDEDRYRLPQQWEEALKFYKASLPPQKYPRRSLHSQSGVRAVHIDNPRASGDEWEGANLYEIGKGEVRVYVLPRQGAGDAPADAAKKPAKKG